MRVRVPALASALISAFVLCMGGATAAPAQDAAAASLPNPFSASQSLAPLRPDTRAESTLRAVVADVSAGGLDMARFSDELGAALAEQEAEIVALIQGYGEIEDVVFMGKEGAGDLFLVRFAEVDIQWFVGINPDGRIGAFLFRPAPMPEAEAEEVPEPDLDATPASAADEE